MYNLRCFPSTNEDAIRCVIQLQNAIVTDRFTVTHTRPSQGYTNRTWAKGAFEAGRHLFGQHQYNSRTYSVSSFPGSPKFTVSYETDYMDSKKAANDLRCACATIATQLMSRLKHKDSFSEKLGVVQRWFAKEFRYKDTGKEEKRSGVET